MCLHRKKKLLLPYQNTGRFTTRETKTSRTGPEAGAALAIPRPRVTNKDLPLSAPTNKARGHCARKRREVCTLLSHALHCQTFVSWVVRFHGAASMFHCRASKPVSLASPLHFFPSRTVLRTLLVSPTFAPSQTPPSFFSALARYACVLAIFPPPPPPHSPALPSETTGLPYIP